MIDRSEHCNLFAPLPASLVRPRQEHQAPAPRTVTLDLRITVPAGTPMIDFARAMSQLASAVNGRWGHRPAPGLPRGRFEVEGQP